MRTFFATLLVFIISANVSVAQEHDVFKVDKSTEKPVLVSYTSKSGALYTGGENKLVLTDTALHVNDYFAKITGVGSMITNRGWMLEVDFRFDFVSDTVTIIIGKANINDTVILNVQKFAVKKIPDAVVAFRGKPVKDSISKSRLLKVKTVHLYVPNDFYENDAGVISSFDMEIEGRKFHSGVIKNVSVPTQLTRAMLRALEKAPIGTTILFTNVTACRPTSALMMDGSSAFIGSYEQRKKGVYCWSIGSTSAKLYK